MRRRAVLFCLMLATGCPPSTSQQATETKTSFFELQLDGQPLRLDHATEHAGAHVFRASGPSGAEGRVQLWLSIDAPAQRIIPYGSGGSERLQRRWRVVFAKGTTVYRSPEHPAIGATLDGDQGALRITRDGLVTEGTFSTPVTREGAPGETIELTDVRFRFYKTRYLDHVGDSDLRGGMFTGPTEDVPNMFGPAGLSVGERTDAVSAAIRALEPEELIGTWQLYRQDILEPTFFQNVGQSLPEPGTFVDFHQGGAPSIRHSEDSNQFFQSPATGEGREHIIYFFQASEQFVFIENETGILRYFEHVADAGL